MSAIPSLQRSSSRPSTPHRLINRSALTQQSPKQHFGIDGSVPLIEEQFVELADSFAVLDDNLIKVNLINESIVKFNESFSALLYGLLTNSYCTEFTEAPTTENFNETYYDLDSQIRLKNREIHEFLQAQEASERMKEKETTATTTKRVLTHTSIGNTNTPKTGTKSSFKKPLTAATLSRLSKQRSSYLPSPHARSVPNSSSASRFSNKNHFHRPHNNADISYMTNDSFVENPSTNNNSKLKRKSHFGSGGSVYSSSAEGSQSKIPVRMTNSAAPKPAWK